MLRGRTITAKAWELFSRRRQEIREQVASIEHSGFSSGRLLTSYEIHGFPHHGLLPAPPQLRGAPRRWLAQFPGGAEGEVRIADGFVWPLYRFFATVRLRGGDYIHASFDLARQSVRFEHVAGSAARRTLPVSAGREHPERLVLQVLFQDL